MVTMTGAVILFTFHVSPQKRDDDDDDDDDVDDPPQKKMQVETSILAKQMGFASTNRESTREKKTWIQDTFEVQKPWSKPRAITNAIARGTHSESIG